MTDTTAAAQSADSKRPDQHRAWWRRLILFGGAIAILVVASWLVPAGTSLWTIGVLGILVMSSSSPDPEQLSKFGRPAADNANEGSERDQDGPPV